MANLIVLCGPAGSGKSTLAKEYVEQGYTRINQDEQGRDHLRLFEVALASNKNVIVDRMGFSKQQRDRYLLPAKDNSYTTKIIVLHESRKECLIRMINRQDHPTIKNADDANNALNTFFGKYERPLVGEADEIEFRYPEGAKEPAIWIDIDNTLSDSSHREHHLRDGNGWKAFFAEIDKDPVNLWCKSLMEGMINTCNVLIVSARPDNYRQTTKEWLERNDIPYNELLMRPRNDHRKDSLIKEIIYDFEIKTRFNLLFSVDDRKQVIDHIRSRGVTVLDCAGEKGNF